MSLFYNPKEADIVLNKRNQVLGEVRKVYDFGDISVRVLRSQVREREGEPYLCRKKDLKLVWRRKD